MLRGPLLLNRLKFSDERVKNLVHCLVKCTSDVIMQQSVAMCVYPVFCNSGCAESCVALYASDRNYTADVTSSWHAV